MLERPRTDTFHSRRWARCLLASAAGGALLFALGACSAPTSNATDASPVVRLPEIDAAFLPSLARIDGPLDTELFADIALCTQCHEGAAATHAASAHARSSFDNPWYRAVVDRVRSDVGMEASRHCAGCHDPLLLFSGAMERPIEPADALARAGVTCLVCHSVRETRSDGNASYTLDTSPVPLPDPNDAESIAAHVARVALPPLRTPGLCASCHRGFLGSGTGNPTFFPGIDEPGPWRGSAYAGSLAQRLDTPVAERDCRGCHVEPVFAPGDMAADSTGFVASHRFAGGHSALASAAGDDAWLDAVRRRSTDIASIDVAALVRQDGTRALPPDGAAIRAGETISLDVVVRNLGVGHRFPGGARDLRDHFVELVVYDATGRIVAEAGTTHAAGSSEDDTAFLLRTAVLDEEGSVEREHLTHRFRALGWDHTIGPRDALAVRYEVSIPADAVLPLTVEASLRARRHEAGVRALACAATTSERGRAFDAAVRGAGDTPLDGCAPEPVLDLSHVEVQLGGDAPLGERPAYERLFDHALALAHSAQENLDEVRPSVAAALALLDELGEAEAETRDARARLLLVLAYVEAHEGRLDDALSRADEVEALVGHDPAIDRVRGHALAQVWRWSAAMPVFARVTASAPFDTEAWRDLGRAAGSAGEDRVALHATEHGLRLLPRDEALLRSQALALGALGDARSTAAHDAFLAFRRPDDETHLRIRCDELEPTCLRDRQPLVVIVARGPPAL